MSGVVQRSGPILPPIISLHHPESMDIWAIYRAYDRRFLPTQLINEPISWLEDMLKLDSLYDALTRNDDG